MNVYVLWHIHELHDDYGPHDEEKLIGIYSTEEHHYVRGRYCRDHRINKTACQICTNF